MIKKINLMKSLTFASAFALLFTVACSEKESINPAEINGVTQEVMDQFTAMGFDVSDITMTDGVNALDPSEKGNYLVEGDIVFTPEALQSMVDANVSGGSFEEQYRTNALVTNNRTIRVFGYTGAGNALDGTMQTALQWAVDNYNALNIGLNFTLTFGSSGYSSYDIVVYNNNQSGGGGSAGFPSGGDPYQWVQINAGTSSYGTNVVEHVMTHEIGHALGFRHTDYFNRSLSCGSGGNEGTAGVGAVHIPGTPTGTDYNSIMQACFSASENGEFGNYDRIALEYLY